MRHIMKLVDVNQYTTNDIWRMALLICLGLAMVIIPDAVYASKTPMGNVLCTTALWFKGNTGKGLATIAVCVIGIGALNGKVSWGMAITVGVGIAIVFGASGLVDKMGANAAAGCATV